MDIFQNAISIRLVSYRDKYLSADYDEEGVLQDDDGRRRETIWKVELVEGKDAIRLRSCYDTYLTASTIPLLPGVTAKKVVQTPFQPEPSDPAIEWEPLRDGMQVKLRSSCGNFLRPNGGFPPWRNIVTHDIPHLPNSGNKILWDVQIVKKRSSPTNSSICRSRSLSSLNNTFA